MAAMDSLFRHYFADGDLELGGYRVQALAQNARAAFTRNAVFPHLGDVAALSHALHDFTGQIDQLREARPGALDGLSVQMGDVQRQASPFGVPLNAEAFARWACELLDPLVHEGQTILSFAQHEVTLDVVGLLPACAREGYLLIEQRTGWQAYRFAAYLLSASQAAELRVDAVAGVYATSPEALKKMLLTACPDLPIPATFCLHSDIAFPVEATLIPVAGRKLPPLLFGTPGVA